MANPANPFMATAIASTTVANGWNTYTLPTPDASATVMYVENSGDTVAILLFGASGLPDVQPWMASAFQVQPGANAVQVPASLNPGTATTVSIWCPGRANLTFTRGSILG